MQQVPQTLSFSKMRSRGIRINRRLRKVLANLTPKLTHLLPKLSTSKSMSTVKWSKEQALLDWFLPNNREFLHNINLLPHRISLPRFPRISNSNINSRWARAESRTERKQSEKIIRHPQILPRIRIKTIIIIESNLTTSTTNRWSQLLQLQHRRLLKGWWVEGRQIQTRCALQTTIGFCPLVEPNLQRASKTQVWANLPMDLQVWRVKQPRQWS